MPIYTYECDICELRLDKLVPMDERDRQTCESCGTRLRQVITGCSIARVPGRFDTPGRDAPESTSEYQGVPEVYKSEFTEEDRLQAKKATEHIRGGRIK